MLFLCRDIGPIPRPAGAKSVRASAKRVAADSNFILKHRFKKNSEFFSECINGVNWVVKFFSVCRSDLSAVSQIIFIEYLRR